MSARNSNEPKYNVILTSKNVNYIEKTNNVIVT